MLLTYKNLKRYNRMNATNKNLIEHLINTGIIKNLEIGKIMEKIDRKYYCSYTPYYDSPQGIGYGVTISAPHMHAWAL